MRKLFTTNDEVKVSLQRCLAMSGTDVIGKRNDLLFHGPPADRRGGEGAAAGAAFAGHRRHGGKGDGYVHRGRGAGV